ncbi:Hydra magnipapillata [Nesidiocoris tenuis]|uniref:Hydra magnipapillata n=1 Tax=Nesidiocoris tenuis TaxID=355587 RepID=A0ABN7ABW2_9HEMI|nr:Hydra magnipapillata [Nesidiocoris tenuis]
MFSCAVSGTISQADPSFSPFENVQCLANSVVAICLSTKLPDRRFTQSQQIDAVLRAGHDLYRSLRVGTPKRAVFLAADEVPGRIRFSSNQDFAVEKHYIATDLETPQTVNRKNKETVEKLRRNLERCFAVSHGSIWPAVDNEVDGFIFTAQNKTVGFWKGANNVFHVFDPHAVNQLRLFTLVGGKARVFDCPARGKSLLNCLLADLNMINNVAYEIVRIRVVVGTRIPRPFLGPTVGLFTPPPPPRSIQLPPRTPTASPEKKKFKTCDDQTAAATSSSLPKTRLPSLIASPTSKRVGGRDGAISEGNDKIDDKTIQSPVSGAKSPTDSKRPADTRKPLYPFAAAARHLFSSVGDEEPVAPKSPDPMQKTIIDDTAMEVEETTLPPPPSQHDSFEPLTSAVGTTPLPSGESSGGLLATGSGDGDGQPETSVQVGKKVGGRPKKRTPKPRLATTQKLIARDAKKRCRDQKRAEIENIVDAADNLSISTPPVVDSSLPAADVVSAPPAAPSPPSIPSPGETREVIISSSDGTSSPVVGDDAVIDSVVSTGSQRSRGRPKKRGRPKLADKTPQQISAETSKVYREKHPDRVEESRKKHVANHPDAVDRSRKDYAERNPEQVSQSRQIYAQTHPEQVRDSQRAYVASHRDDFLLYQSQYNETRSLPAPLRQFTCLGDREGVDLDEIQPYTLSRPASLADESTYRCRHCNAPFFNEERRRTMWCCGDGDLVLPPLPPIDCPVYDDPYFLNHARAYNNVFCFSALGTSRHVRAPPSGVSLVKIQGKVYHRLFNLDDRRSSAINNTLMWIEDNVERYAVAQNQRLDRQKIRDLEAYLLSVNPFSNRIRQLSKETAEDAHLVFFQQQQQQQQRGQIVTGEEGVGGGEPPPAPSVIAAVIRYGAAEPRQAVIWKAGDRSPQVVHFLDPSFEPLQYPLLFPHGSAGWSKGFASTTNKKLTLIK